MISPQPTHAPASISPAPSAPAWVWVAGAVALGAAVGLLVGRGTLAPLTVALAVGLIALAALSFRRLEFGLIALLFTLPLDTYGRLIETPVTVTVFHVVLLICLAAWVRKIVTEPGWVRFSWLDAAAAALVGAGLWSLPHSLAPSTTLVSVIRLAFLWAFAALYASGIRDSRTLRRVLGWLVGTGVLLSLMGIAQFYLPDLGIGWIRDVLRAGGAVSFSRIGAFFYDPNYLAGLLSAIVAVSLSLLVHAHRRRAALLWGGAAALTGLVLVLTYSRGGWVGAAAGILVAVVTAPSRRRAWLVSGLVVVAIAIAIAAPDLIVSRVQSITNVETDVSVATRYYMNVSMGEMIADRPVFGTGLGAFDQTYPYFRRPGTSLDIIKPHQVPLAFIAETGIAGVLAELTLLGGLVALYWRRRPDGWGALEAAVLVGTVTLLVGTLFEYYLYFEYVWLFLGLSVVATRLARTQKEDD